MADAFGIFREDSVPVFHGVPSETPSFIKGKGQRLNIKKKALGDVSNIVSKKGLNVKPNETGGKLSSESCAGVHQDVSVGCKPVVEEKQVSKEKSDVSCKPAVEEKQVSKEISDVVWSCKTCYTIFESDYDILPKSERLSDEAMDLLTSSYTLRASSPLSESEMDYDLPCYSPPLFLPPDSEDLPEVDIPIYDSDLSDLSF